MAGRELSVFTRLSTGMELWPFRIDPGNNWEEISEEAGNVAPDDNIVTNNHGVARDGHVVGLGRH